MFRQVEQTAQKIVEPLAVGGAAGEAGGQGKGQEGGHGLRTHCGEVAQTSGKAAVPGRGSRVPVATEVSAFQGKVSGYKDIVALWGTQDGTIIPDAEADCAAGASGAIAKVVDELEFAAGHVLEDTGEKVRLFANASRIYECRERIRRTLIVVRQPVFTRRLRDG